MQLTNKQHRNINIILIALAAALRFYNLGAAPLWYDEAFTDLATRLPLARMIQALAGDVHPPAHYFILWLGQRIGLSGAFGLRLFSALASLGSVILAGYLIRLMAQDADDRDLISNPWLETITIGLMAFAPMNLHYSQEARMYAMLQLLILIGMVAIYKQLWGILTIAAALTMLTHTYGLFYCLGLAVIALVVTGYKWIKIFVSFGLAGLIWLPWGFVMLNQMRELQSSGYWIQPISWGRIISAIQKMIFSFSLPNEMAIATMIILGAGFVILIATLARSSPSDWLPLAIMAAAPLLLAVIASLIYRPVLLFRPLIGSLPMILMLVAVVIVKQDKPGRILSAVLLIPLMISLAAGYHHYNLINKGSSDPWLDEIRASWIDGSVVYALNDSSSLAMLHGAPDLIIFTVIFLVIGLAFWIWSAIDIIATSPVGVLNGINPFLTGLIEALSMLGMFIFLSVTVINLRMFLSEVRAGWLEVILVYILVVAMAWIMFGSAVGGVSAVFSLGFVVYLYLLQE